MVLQFEEVFERALKAVSPQLRAGFRLDQLRGDAHPPTTLPDRTFEDVAHAQFATDPLNVDRLTLVGERAIARDHEQPSDARQSGDDLLDHPVREIFLLWISTHIGEGQHGD